MSALLWTLGSFLLILVLTRLKVPLAGAVLAGAVALGLAFGLAPIEVALACLHGVLQPISIAVVVAVVLLLAISELMHLSGRLDDIVALASAWLRRPALTVAALPAIIGLLPMPGGALFSAPMVQAAAGKAGVRPAVLSAVNYWFRHIWEHWWPLYPGVILAISLTGSTVASFAILQLPVGVLMAAAGLLMLRHLPAELLARSRPTPPGTLRRLLQVTSPISIILAVWAAATVGLRLVPLPLPPGDAGEAIQRYLPITAGLLVSLIWTAWRGGIGVRQAARVIARPSVLPLIGLVMMVMAYQHVLAVTQAGSLIAAEMTAHRLPVLLVVAGLPLIAGLVTGIAFGFVGVSFPIVLGLVAALPDAPAMRPYAMLAYACGHLGMMISPIHLCYVVSNRYFKIGFGPVYRRLAMPAILTAIGVVLYYVVLRALLG